MARIKLLDREKPGQCLSPSKGRAPPSTKRRGSLLPRGGRALVKRLGLGVSKADWATPSDFVCKDDLLPLRRLVVPGDVHGPPGVEGRRNDRSRENHQVVREHPPLPGRESALLTTYWSKSAVWYSFNWSEADPGTVFNLRTTTSQKCEAVPRRARI